MRKPFNTSYMLANIFHDWFGTLGSLIFFFRCVNEGGPAHAKRFTFAVRVNTTDKGWTDECVGEPMPSVKKAKDSAAVLLLDLLNKLYS